MAARPHNAEARGLTASLMRSDVRVEAQLRPRDVARVTTDLPALAAAEPALLAAEVRPETAWLACFRASRAMFAASLPWRVAAAFWPVWALGALFGLTRGRGRPLETEAAPGRS